MQHSIRHQPGRRTHDRHRDEPPRVAFVSPGIEGDRLSHRQDRGPSRDRLHTRRDPQRHHAADAGIVRADARLRRREGPPLRLREVPRSRYHLDYHDEECRRGDGHRPQLRRGVEQGPAIDGAAVGCLLLASFARRNRCSRGSGANEATPRWTFGPGAAGAVGRGEHRRGVRGDRHRPVVPRPHLSDQ